MSTAHSAAGVSPRHRVVIVGGGFAGLRAAKALKRAPVDITLIDRRNFHLFQPLLYQVATGSLSPGEIATPLRAVLRRQKNVRVVLGEVHDFDLAARDVLVGRAAGGGEDLRLPYDSLIVATGMKNHYFGHDEWSSSAPALKSLEDALAIRRRVLIAFEAAEMETGHQVRREWLTFVVVGGGPTGVELAGQIGEIAGDTMRNQFNSFDPAGARVLLLEGADRILLAFEPGQSDHAVKALGKLGVTVQTDTLVRDVDDEGVTVEHAGTQEHIAARTIVWAAGVAATSLAGKLANAAGLATDRVGRVPVGEHLTIDGHPEVFALGDMVTVTDKKLPGVAPTAMQMGSYAGRAIRDRLRGRDTAPFAYKDKGNVATIGRAKAVADISGVRFHGFVAWWLWLALHLFYLIGFQNRVLVLVRWSWSFITRGRGARLITGDGLAPEWVTAPKSRS
jgi:NADH:ubiquinone reductase (H+-translocating)